MGRKDCGKTGLHFDRPSLVQIQFADDCDINITVKRFMRTGVMPPASGRTPITGDFTNIPDNLPARPPTANLIKSFKNLFQSIFIDQTS